MHISIVQHIMEASEILGENTASQTAGRLTWKDLTRAVRTRQWAKNALLLAGFLFSGQLRAPVPEMLDAFGRVALAVACFCALSATAYLINDWSDLERDRLHPIKRVRPLASGRMSTRVALGLIVFFLLLGIASAVWVAVLEPNAAGFCIAAAAYLVLTLAYSFVLKHEVIVDVLSVAAGFVVRVVAGCLAIPVRISPWIILCTFTLALFVALCKRRAELLEMGDSSADTRRVLPFYSVAMLDTYIAIASGLTITAYSLYTFNATESTGFTPAVSHTPLLMTTIPFVIYGIFRFLFLAHSSPVGGEPEQMLRDKKLMLNVLLWGLLVAALTLL